MVKVVFILGLAGSGKTMLTRSLLEWFKISKQPVASLNLDPGVLNLPYEPSIDIREYINIWDLMQKYSIGPNSALIMSMDLAIEFIEHINREIRRMNPKLLIIDTPGQMEIFAYRMIGKYLVEFLEAEEKMIIFVMDALFVKDPKNLVSNILLGVSVRLRFDIPMIYVLNKIDMLNEEEEKRIRRWFKNSFYLQEELEKHYSPDEVSLLVRIFRLIKSHNLLMDYIPLSALTLENVDILIQALTRILFRGEEKEW